MVGRGDLRKPLGLGEVRFVAAHTQDGGVELRRLHRSRIIGVLRQWTMASLAVEVDVLAAFLLFHHVRVAVFTGLVAGKIHRTSRDLLYGVPAIVPVLSEALGYQRRAYRQKQENAGDKNCR